MLPTLIIAKVAGGIAVKLGLDQLSKQGYLPQTSYLSSSLRAIQEDDLDKAIREYRQAIKRRKPGEKSEIVYENIVCAIEVRKHKLRQRTSELQAILHPSIFSLLYWRRKLNFPDPQAILQAQDEQRSCQEATRLLDKLRARLDE